ncbi:kelch-like protein 26 [Cimex lectularius]|uniref:Kelch-like protein diablo n=1 Tax=Cimex lectularius TaxID=79782 RepID=A0A8I6RDY2_CIMLE|nr:kelch-like protein 26 [Cimex lectularius]XP_014244124.1 kelch-like protein 26 [Cimex lectularius]XP_014244126.1 kelch-like protein 26 [Cimex lectularius]
MRGKEWILVERGRPLNTVTFESPSHNATILSGLNVLRSKGHLLDITLIAQGETFQAHKVVLASCSDYFRAMFTDAMKESRQSEICLNGVSAAGMRLLLEYAYTSRLALNLANVQDVLSAASHIQLVAVVEACSNYLQSQLDLDNCVDIATISETYSLKQLRTVVYRYMSCHLVEFARSSEFTRLHPQQLEYLLSCDFPVDCPEVEVLEITLRWLQCYPLDSHSKSMWITRLVHKIHISEVSWWELDTLLEAREHYLAKLVYEAIRQNRHHRNSSNSSTALLSPSSPLVNSRGMTLAIIKVGGFGMGGITNEITYMQPSSRKWRHLTSIPHVEQCNFGTAVLNNDLYVVGGCFNQSLQENIHPFGFRYSPRRDSWATMAPMQRERCRFSLNVLSGYLFAVGGVSEGDGIVSECERYDPSTDIWERVAPLPGPSTQHAAATLDNYLYISGGLDRDITLSSMKRYDSEQDRWEILTPLPTPRADHTMLSLQGRLYVCGGWLEDELTANRVLVDSIDCYDPAEGRWTTVATVPTPRYHAGIVAYNNKIYFIGGYRSDAMFDTATAVIECYDLTSGAWTSEEKYPQDIWEHTCVTLYIPTCRDDMEVLTATKL